MTGPSCAVGPYTQLCVAGSQFCAVHGAVLPRPVSRRANRKAAEQAAKDAKKQAHAAAWAAATPGQKKATYAVMSVIGAAIVAYIIAAVVMASHSGGKGGGTGGTSTAPEVTSSTTCGQWLSWSYADEQSTAASMAVAMHGDAIARADMAVWLAKACQGLDSLRVEDAAAGIATFDHHDFRP